MDSPLLCLFYCDFVDDVVSPLLMVTRVNLILCLSLSLSHYHVSEDTVDNLTEYSGYVRFSPSYATCMKICQSMIIAGCMGGFTTAPAIPVLLPIILVCVFATLLPSLLHCVSHTERLCNVPSVLSIRSGSYLCVTWTAIVCLIRSFAPSPEWLDNTVIFGSEGVGNY